MGLETRKSPIENPQFFTHKNYLSYMRCISDKLCLSCNNNSKSLRLKL